MCYYLNMNKSGVYIDASCTHMCVCVCVRIYIYIYREREREREGGEQKLHVLSVTFVGISVDVVRNSPVQS
jgi:hypothetical protein